MAGNLTPRIQAAKGFATQFGGNKVVVILLNEDAGTIECITWGDSQHHCEEAAEIGEVLYDEAREFYRRRMRFMT